MSSRNQNTPPASPASSMYPPRRETGVSRRAFHGKMRRASNGNEKGGDAKGRASNGLKGRGDSLG